MITNAPMFKITADITLAAGSYVKVGATRVGTAFLTIAESGALSYTNRRGETVAVTLSQFARHYASGLTTLSQNATVARNDVTVATLVVADDDAESDIEAAYTLADMELDIEAVNAE